MKCILKGFYYEWIKKIYIHIKLKFKKKYSRYLEEKGAYFVQNAHIKLNRQTHSKSIIVASFTF